MPTLQIHTQAAPVLSLSRTQEQCDEFTDHMALAPSERATSVGFSEFSTGIITYVSLNHVTMWRILP